VIFQEKFQENMGGGGESTVRWGELSFMMTTAGVGWFEKLSALSMGGVIMGDNFSRVIMVGFGGKIITHQHCCGDFLFSGDHRWGEDQFFHLTHGWGDFASLIYARHVE